jgi:N-acetylmuramoyl-L-alanine amidase
MQCEFFKILKIDKGQNLYRIFCIHLLLSLAALNCMGAELIKIRLGQHENQKVRIVLDVSEPVQWAVQDQSDPNTLILSVAANTSNANLPKNSQIVKEIQLNEPLMLKFKKPVTVEKAFSIPPSRENANYRIVLDIQIGSKEMELLKPISAPKPAPLPKVKELLPAPEKPSQKIIIIDAGHGGEDPGAVGCHKSREKDITFKMANLLKETIEKNPQYKVVLTRPKDRSMRLRDRVRIARSSQGDLFISLHADSNDSPDAKGLSIYTLSHVASDRDAERLAARENKADMIMGVELEAESPEVANILIDLVKRETMNMSAKFASALIKSLKHRVNLLKNTHRFAAFGVLRSPDVPSILVELGFLSNREDEKLLNSKAYRQKIADGIMEGITLYFEQSANIH